MPTKKIAPKKKRMSQGQMREAVVGDMIGFLMTIPEISESYSPADLQLAIEDVGWINPRDYGASGDMGAQHRTRQVKQSRFYWNIDPLAKQAVRLWTDYCLGGEGISTKVIVPEDDSNTEDPTADPAKPVAEAVPVTGAVTKPLPSPVAKTSAKTPKPAAQIKIDKFMKSRRNSRVMSAKGQQRSSKKLLIDGEVFFAVFTNTGETPTIRTVEPLQMEPITDPDDDETVLVWRRMISANKTIYYRDWTATDEELSSAKLVDPTSRTPLNVAKLEKDVVIYSLTFDEIKLRGNGLLFAALDWFRETRKFMEARVSIVQALAQFSWQTKVQGGQATVNAIKGALESTIKSGASIYPDRNPKSVAGSTLVENGGIDTKPMPRVTGAGDAKTDGDTFKLMVCAGVGIMLHYFGDPSTGNLATATAMELPMKKMFAGYQKLWKDAYRDIFSIVLEEDPDGEDEPIDMDIDLPSIVEDDLQSLSAYLTALAGVFPEIKIPEILKDFISAMGVDDVDEVMKKIAAMKVQQDAQAKEQAAQNAKNPQFVNGVPVNPDAVAQATSTKESMDQLKTTLQALLEKL